MFNLLKSVLSETSKGLCLKGIALNKPDNKLAEKPPLLKYYMVDDSIQKIIRHNLQWAIGKKKKPKFKFAYLALPTSCNQRCKGCFTGQDKAKLLPQLNGKMYSSKTLKVVNFLKEHGAEAIVYSGGGELFTWSGAFDYISQITNLGMGMVIFTNGTLLAQRDIEWLSNRDISLIVSMRDTTERDHNDYVGIDGFQKTLQTIEWAMQCGLRKENRLAVEMPVVKANEKRVLDDFIPAMRQLGVIPLAEEYIQIMASPEEKSWCHNFAQTRKFFDKAAEIDRELGYYYEPKFGQRMMAQPKCERSLYSFIIYPSGDVMDCPSSSVKYGNLYQTPLKEIIYSETFKDALKNFQLCPCSMFYTSRDSEIPANLPQHLWR